MTKHFSLESLQAFREIVESVPVMRILVVDRDIYDRMSKEDIRIREEAWRCKLVRANPPG
jgi:hypothetical protein